MKPLDRWAGRLAACVAILVVGSLVISGAGSRRPPDDAPPIETVSPPIDRPELAPYMGPSAEEVDGIIRRREFLRERRDRCPGG